MAEERSAIDRPVWSNNQSGGKGAYLETPLYKEKDFMDSGVTPMLDLRHDGQQGPMRVNRYWVNNAPHVRQKIIPVVVDYPKAIQWIGDGSQDLQDYIKLSLKKIFETWPQAVSGLNATVDWTFGDVQVGNSGEVFSTPIGAKIAVSAPSFTFSEKYGAAIRKFLQWLGRKLYIDPELGVPGIIADKAYIDAGSPPLLPNDISMQMMFIEPANNYRDVTWAWYVTNMMWRSSGDVTGDRTMGGDAEVPEVTIETTAFTTSNTAGVYRMAYKYLEKFAKQGLKPYYMDSFASPEKFSDFDKELSENDIAGTSFGPQSGAGTVPPSSVSKYKGPEWVNPNPQPDFGSYDGLYQDEPGLQGTTTV